MKLEKNGVLVEEPELLEKLRHTGAYLSDGNLLPLYEALYFSEKGILPLEPEAVRKALQKKDKAADIRYRVFAFLWNHGYITRESEDSELFRIHRKGIRAGEDRTENVMRVIKEGEKYDLKRMHADLEIAGKLRKQFVLAIVGEGAPQVPVIQFIKISRSRFD